MRKKAQHRERKDNQNSGKKTSVFEAPFPELFAPFSRAFFGLGCPPIFHPHNVCFGFTFGILNCFPFYSATSPRKVSESGKINHALCSIEGAKKGLKSNFRILSTEKKEICYNVCTNVWKLVVFGIKCKKRARVYKHSGREFVKHLFSQRHLHRNSCFSPPRSFPFHNTQGW